jgi:type I restriction enzyme R subunit
MTPWPKTKSAVDVLGDQQLAIIARELVEKIKQNVTIDWTIKETVRAKMRVLVKKILRTYG